MKLNVDHLVVVSQDLEVPDVCPNCEADLTEEDALLCWEFQDQQRRTTNKKFKAGEWWRVSVKNKLGDWVPYDARLYDDENEAFHLAEKLHGKEGIHGVRIEPLQEDEYELEWGFFSPEAGEGYLYSEWQCANCREVLGTANEVRYNLDAPSEIPHGKPPPGIVDLLKIDDKS